MSQREFATLTCVSRRTSPYKVKTYHMILKEGVKVYANIVISDFESAEPVSDDVRFVVH